MVFHVNMCVGSTHSTLTCSAPILLLFHPPCWQHYFHLLCWFLMIHLISKHQSVPRLNLWTSLSMFAHLMSSSNHMTLNAIHNLIPPVWTSFLNSSFIHRTFYLTSPFGWSVGISRLTCQKLTSWLFLPKHAAHAVFSLLGNLSNCSD